jgi:hypothetical protein
MSRLNLLDSHETCLFYVRLGILEAVPGLIALTLPHPLRITPRGWMKGTSRCCPGAFFTAEYPLGLGLFPGPSIGLHGFRIWPGDFRSANRGCRAGSTGPGAGFGKRGAGSASRGTGSQPRGIARRPSEAAWTIRSAVRAARISVSKEWSRFPELRNRVAEAQSEVQGHGSGSGWRRTRSGRRGVGSSPAA